MAGEDVAAVTSLRSCILHAKGLHAPRQLTLTTRVQVVLAYVPAVMASYPRCWCTDSTTDGPEAPEMPGDAFLCGIMGSDEELVTATRLRRIMQLKAAISGL